MNHEVFSRTQLTHFECLLSGYWHTHTKYLVPLCIHAVVQWHDDELYFMWKQVDR